MRLLRLLDDDSWVLELHPYVTAIRALDESRRAAVIDAFHAAVTGRTTGLGGLLEAHGIVLDLADRHLRMLELTDVDTEAVVVADDLPGSVPPALLRDITGAERRLAGAQAALGHAEAVAAGAATRQTQAQEALDAAIAARAGAEAAIADGAVAEAGRAEALGIAVAAVDGLAAPAARAAGAVERLARELAEAEGAHAAAVDAVASRRREAEELAAQRDALTARLDPDAAELLAHARDELASVSEDRQRAADELDAARAERDETVADRDRVAATRRDATADRERAQRDMAALARDAAAAARAAQEAAQRTADENAARDAAEQAAAQSAEPIEPVEPVVSTESDDAVDAPAGGAAAALDPAVGITGTGDVDRAPDPAADVDVDAVVDAGAHSDAGDGTDDRRNALTSKLALHDSFAPGPVRAALELGFGAAGDQVPSVEATGLADQLVELASRQRDHGDDAPLDGDELRAAAQRSEAARAAYAQVEQRSRPATATVGRTELERLHAALQDAENELGNRRRRGEAKRFIDELRAELTVALEMHGFTSWTDYLTSATAPVNDPQLTADIQQARLAVLAADAELHDLQARADRAAAIENRSVELDRVRAQARSLLAEHGDGRVQDGDEHDVEELDDDRLTDALRALRVPADRRAVVAALTEALEGVGFVVEGMDLSEDDLRLMAEEWLHDYDHDEQQRRFLVEELAEPVEARPLSAERPPVTAPPADVDADADADAGAGAGAGAHAGRPARTERARMTLPTVSAVDSGLDLFALVEHEDEPAEPDDEPVPDDAAAADTESEPVESEPVESGAVDGDPTGADAPATDEPAPHELSSDSALSEEIEARLTELEGDVRGRSETIAELDEQLVELELTVAAHDDRVAGLVGQIADLEERVTKAEAVVSIAERRVEAHDALQAELAELDERLATHGPDAGDDDVDALEARAEEQRVAHAAAVAEHERLETSRRDAEADIVRLRAESRTEAERYRLADRVAAVIDAEAALVTASEARAEADAECDEARAACDEARAAVAALDEQREALAGQPVPLEEIEWYLLARLAAQREVGFAGSLPLVIDRALDDLGDRELRTVLDRLERMAGSVQIVHITDDPRIHDWAERAGMPRAASVEPVSLAPTGTA